MDAAIGEDGEDKSTNEKFIDVGVSGCAEQLDTRRTRRKDLK